MPDFMAQFRKQGPDLPRVYMGGTAMSCGKHPSLPKRHRWGPWQEINLRGGGKAWERMCLTCALMSDMEFRRPRSLRAQSATQETKDA